MKARILTVAQSRSPALGVLPGAINAQVRQTQTGNHPAAGQAASGQENAPIAVPSTKPASKKRKSTEQHEPVPSVDLDSIDLEGAPITENCGQVGRKINNLLDSGAVTKTAFANEIGVSVKSLTGFLTTSGLDNGSGFAAYPAAWEYFKKREIAGVKLPAAKKQKTGAGSSSKAAASAAVDLSDVVLRGEDHDSVPVFDSCDEIRRKINAHLKKPGVTQAQFLRDVYAQLKGPSRPGRPFQGVQLARFRETKGALNGAKSPIFYGAYVFFEKMRINEGKPKSKHRLDMEKQWGSQGISRDHDGREQ